MRARVPKVTRLFLGIQTSEQDPLGSVLRVIPGDHARFSIWLVDRPVAAISVTESDAEALGRFLLDPEPAAWPSIDTADTTG